MLDTRVAASRRWLLVAGASGTALAVGGCDLDPRSAGPPASSPTTGAPADASEERDLELLEQSRLGVLGVLEHVRSTTAAYPRLHGPLTAIRDLHEAHLGVLEDAGADPRAIANAPAVTPDGPGAALTQLRRYETRHQHDLERKAVRAASGSFARMLASMSAGVAQHVAVLPVRP